MTGIELRNVYKSYGENNVLSAFSHVFKTGTVSCVMGPSGCGKTTLMRLILGLESPDAGEIILPEGTVISPVFQEDRLIKHLSAIKNLSLVCGRDKAEQSAALLREMGLEESLNKSVKELSGGMARRVAIARSLIYEANVYIMDEPLKGLDDETRLNAVNAIKKATSGKTLVLITHDARDAEDFGGEKVILKLS